MSEQRSVVRTRTAESVTEGHPDKVADQISDAILDACLEQDPGARVACETLVTGQRVVLAGEITTTAEIDREAVVRQTVAEIGYIDRELGFDAATLSVIDLVSAQSPEIAAGVGRSLEARQGSVDPEAAEGAGDQGVVYGYATLETRQAIPFPQAAANELVRRLAQARRDGTLSWLRPDGKAQVTVAYDARNRPIAIDRVVLSSQHDPDVSLDRVRAELLEHVVLAADLRPWPMDDPFEIDPDRVQINPAGSFSFGGPAADTGLTGRKIVVDAYGGSVPVGGGAFSGKDPSKVDRSAAYAARHVAVNLVHGGFAKEVLVQIAYAIGVAEPVAIQLDTFSDRGKGAEHLTGLVRQEFDLRPAAIRAALDLNRPIYRQTAAYGHFGREDLELAWDRRDRSTKLVRLDYGLASLSNDDLVTALNRTLASPAWVAAKGRYLVALRDELADRGLTVPFHEQDGIYVFGQGSSYAIEDGAVIDTTDREPR